MARKQEPSQGRLLVYIVHSSLDALSDALSALEKRFGLVQFETLELPDNKDDFYREEMGDNLQRRGVLTPSNIVMASHREYNHRVYLENGVYAELALVWSKGRYVRLPWTNTDFYHGEAIEFFQRVRESFNLVAEPILVAED